MNKEILKSSWLTAGLILFLNFVFAWLFLMVFNLFRIETGNSASSVVSVIIASMIIGMFYTSKFKGVMPKKQRLMSGIIYAVLSLFIALIYLAEFFYDKVLLTIMIITSLFVSGLSIAMIYYFLRKGGELYLKSKNGN